MTLLIGEGEAVASPEPAGSRPFDPLVLAMILRPGALMLPLPLVLALPPLLLLRLAVAAAMAAATFLGDTMMGARTEEVPEVLVVWADVDGHRLLLSSRQVLQVETMSRIT